MLNPFADNCSITFSRMSSNLFFGYFVGESENFFVSSAINDNISEEKHKINPEEVIHLNQSSFLDKKALEILQVSPNPASMMMNIEYFNSINVKIELKINDITGRILDKFEIDNNAGVINRYDLDVSKYKSGIYILQIFSSGCSDSKIILIQR